MTAATGMRAAGRAMVVAAILALGACVARPSLAPDAAAVAERFAAIKVSPPELTAFLRALPKGGDLHNHLSGAVYAESYIAWAVADGLCLVIATQTIAPPPCDARAGRPPVAEAVVDTAAYNRLIDALSVRNHALRDVSGHDQFFSTFARFDAAGEGHAGDMLAEVMARAADQKILYLELMNSAGMSEARAIGRSALGAIVDWDAGFDAPFERLMSAGLGDTAARADATVATFDSAARGALGCAPATPAPAPACGVEVRYIAQVIRVFPPEQVFAQIALGFLLAERSDRVVGLNLVAPEDDRISLRDYALHMRMIGALAKRFSDVGITLHAGELALGLVPPEALRFHIADAVRVAGADRIGHGVDIMYEDDAAGLLAEMAERRVLVEINLTSNDVILGVAGADHPFETYRAHGVPLALSTDDEGVSRIDLTHEYRRAVLTYDLDYAEVKGLSRNSLTYAFVDGTSLWTDAAATRPVAECANGAPGTATPSAACRAFLAASRKATLQWALEAAFARFEVEQAR